MLGFRRKRTNLHEKYDYPTTGEPSPKPAEHALNKWTLVAAMPITNLSGIALLAG